MAYSANSLEALGLINAVWGLKDPPRAFGMRLRRTLGARGYEQGITDPQVWRTPKRADGATGSGHLQPCQA